MTIKIGATQVEGWSITPKRAADGSLQWSDVGQTVGVGLALGGRFWELPGRTGEYFPEWNSLFEITPGGDVILQEDVCSETPVALIGKDFEEFTRTISTTRRSSAASSLAGAKKVRIVNEPDQMIQWFASSYCTQKGHVHALPDVLNENEEVAGQPAN